MGYSDEPNFRAQNERIELQTDCIVPKEVHEFMVHSCQNDPFLRGTTSIIRPRDLLPTKDIDLTPKTRLRWISRFKLYKPGLWHGVWCQINVVVDNQEWKNRCRTEAKTA
ncbi:hypothetical protein TWF569_005746 [Orbilia oligospora]|uniref:Uncharacterized protein n=1 Tax=Orbilia oligospora TaxID=2813651 RepID=A0A7C8JJW1_ORBOL|nr:hypothetical protein TWF103_009193 [Orbilia oligospora]KAF3128662.1 hypothetical protein TWF703_009243 [Orbilia oligospora]KAF3148405.1 hypothetical protein TWF569_005746 [Orbilia oligospora]